MKEDLFLNLVELWLAKQQIEELEMELEVLKIAAGYDYQDMRKFQAQFIDADQELREMKAQRDRCSAAGRQGEQMQYARCKCGEYEIWTTMGIQPCSWCLKCGTVPAYGPGPHNTERTPHKMESHKVETDGEDATLSRCRYCGRTKRELERDGAPVIDT